MREGERLPGVPDDDQDRVVAHVDVDCFYASCERLREPRLEGEPVVVGMGYEPGEDHGAVATASYEAREHGLESAQAISTALERLPRVEDVDTDEDGSLVQPAAHYRPVDLSFYESVSEDVRSILADCADTVRNVSIDEAYLDLTERTDWETVETFAHGIKARIERSVGVTASVGVAPTMSAAKVASDYDKPDGFVVVEPGEVASFLEPLSVEAIHGVGPVRARDLREMGIETAGDLAAADVGAVEDRFGDRGREIVMRARGEDDREVEPKGRPKSLSRESAFPEAVEEPGPKRDRVRTLARAVAERATTEGAIYRTIGVKAVEPPFEVTTRERSLPGPVDDHDLLEGVALELFEEFAEDPLRKVGVRVSNLSFPAGEQTDLAGFADAAHGRPSADGGTGPPRDGDEGGAGQTSLSEFRGSDRPG